MWSRIGPFRNGADRSVRSPELRRSPPTFRRTWTVRHGHYESVKQPPRRFIIILKLFSPKAANASHGCLLLMSGHLPDAHWRHIRFPKSFALSVVSPQFARRFASRGRGVTSTFAFFFFQKGEFQRGPNDFLIDSYHFLTPFRGSATVFPKRLSLFLQINDRL